MLPTGVQLPVCDAQAVAARSASLACRADARSSAWAALSPTGGRSPTQPAPRPPPRTRPEPPLQDQRPAPRTAVRPRGVIPAGAGSSTVSAREGEGTRGHPRGCGEQSRDHRCGLLPLSFLLVRRAGHRGNGRMGMARVVWRHPGLELIWPLAEPGTGPLPIPRARRPAVAQPASREQEAQRASRSASASAISSGASSAMKCPAWVSRWSRSGAHAFHTAAAS